MTAQTPDESLKEPPFERYKLAIEMARRYYLHDASTPELAKEVGVSRSTISRLIATAREQGWVRIEVAEPDILKNTANVWLASEFGLEQVVDVAVTTSNPLKTVATRASYTINNLIKENMTVGIAWGNTTAAVSWQLSAPRTQASRVVQLAGAGSADDLEIDYTLNILGNFASAWEASAIVFPVPAFFDHPKTREYLWQERSISRVRQIQKDCDAAIFSVGSVRTTAEVPSRVYASNYLSDIERQQLLDDGGIGDIATYFYRDDGTGEGIRLNSRSSGMFPDDFRNIPIRVCVVQGAGKATSLLAALRGGYVTHLIADQELIDQAHRLGFSGDAELIG